jgi:hypothetical protein
MKNIGTWIHQHRLATLGLVLGMALASAGCNESSTSDQQIAQLKVRVADLEKRMSELERLSPLQARQRAYHERFERRSELDRTSHTQQQLTEAEGLYQEAAKKWGSPECIEKLKQMVEKFPDINRTGCAVLYLAQNTDGTESEKYLKGCIEKFNDCYYGDGAQVGALARLYLAEYYEKNQESEKAKTLYQDIKDHYSDAIDHQGEFLTNSIK